MNGFDREYILEKLSEIEDEENLLTTVVKKGEYDDDIPDEVKDFAETVGMIVMADYVGAGTNGYETTGVYSFMPLDEDEPYEVLSINIVLSDAVDEIGIYDMYKIINKVNNRLLAGSFSISDDENVLAYRSNICISKKLDNDNALAFATEMLMEALGEVNLWIDVLMAYNDGDKDADACIDTINDIDLEE